jgi:hypothetical protein
MTLLPLPRLGSFPPPPPFFGYNKCAVYVALREVDLSALFEILGQSLEHAVQNPFLDPPLEAAVASLVGRIALWKVSLGRSGAKYPEDAI